jgi:hypothetical protein
MVSKEVAGKRIWAAKARAKELHGQKKKGKARDGTAKSKELASEGSKQTATAKRKLKARSYWQSRAKAKPKELTSEGSKQTATANEMGEMESSSEFSELLAKQSKIKGAGK